MTSSTKKALPWLVSLGIHLSALTLIAVLLALFPRPAVGPRVDISLVGGSGFGGGPQAARAGTRAAAASGGLALPARPSAKSNSTAAPMAGANNGGTDESGTGPDSYSLQASRNAAASTSAAAVAAADVLSDAATAGSAAVEPAVGSPGSQAGAEPGGSPGLFAGGTEWGWQGLPRKLVRKRNPEFPALLSALGQEVEGEARISVAPSGIVTRVEITRSSGYIEIDASVEAALRDYLFSRVDGRVDSTGTVKFRFRLEKQD
jgi:outer membrane biosynthesis protein TonB